MKRTFLSLAFIVTSAAATAAQALSPAALQEMADTERAFAHAATVNGWRAAFMEFFAPDAVTFTPEPGPVHPGLRSRPVRPFSEEALTWEPRTGDVAASGDLGWLTGPSTFIDHTATPPTTMHGNYLSIWKRLADGTWRVFIDVGTTTNAAVPFPQGFHRMPVASRYSGSDNTQAASKATLLAADRQLNERVASDGAPQAYRAVLNGAEARLHRSGSGSAPAVGTDAVVAWLTEHQAAMVATIGSGEAAKAGDLGYTYGKYEIAGAAPQTGAYVRVWTRDSTGRWLLEADVVAPSRR